jgi:TRAP-type C4-dicarboxylate transport system substrate-binding protein
MVSAFKERLTTMSALKRFFMIASLAAAPAVLIEASGPIRLATLVPANTSWHKALLDMGNTWNKDTAGRVKLTVYAGGTQGDESTMIKKMRPGTDALQASFLTAAGLAELDDAFNVFAMPFFFESDEEEMAVEKKLMPLLDQKLQAKGFHLVCWGTGGWVQVFSKKPLRSLADVKAAKLFTTKGADKWLQWYVKNGFHPVALLPADIPSQMQVPNGLIDTAPNPPYLALSLQIYQHAKYMLDLHIAPLTAAMIISNSAWNDVSAEDKPKVTAAAQALEKRVRAEAPAQDAASVKAMVDKGGLQVITLDPKAAAEFRTAANELVLTMRGTMVPADVFDMAVQERDALRKSKGK